MRRRARPLGALVAFAGASGMLSAAACGIGSVGTAEVASDGDSGAPPPTGTAMPSDASLDSAFDPDANGDGSVDDAGPDGAVDGGDAGPISFVQFVVTPYSNTTTRAATLTVTAGHALVVATYATGSPAMSVTDSLGNTFTSASKTNMTSCSGSIGELWYASNAKGGSDTVTLTVPSSTNIGITVAEYAGVALTNAVEVTSNAIAASSSNAMTAPSLTTTGSRGIVVSFFHDANGAGTMTPGAGQTARARDTGFYTLLQDDAPGTGPGVHAVTAALPTSASDACWGAIAMALRAQ